MATLGSVKTYTAEHYAKDKSNVFIVTMSPDTSSTQAALEEIAIAVGIKDPAFRPAAMRREIERRLKGANSLLIIDEAGELSRESMDTIRRFNDLSGVGIAYIGNEELHTQFNSGRTQAKFARLHSRIGSRKRIKKPTKTDTTVLAKEWGHSK